KDSMGNTEILKRGDLQMTSAGTGISHSEKANGSKEVHFLQIWAIPSTPRLQPEYFTRHYSDASKTDQFVKVVAPVDTHGVSEMREGDGPAPVHSSLTMYATLLSQGKSLTQEMKGKKGYVHVVMRSGCNTGVAQGASVKVNGEVLREGDGAYLFIGEGKVDVENVGDSTAEMRLFYLEYSPSLSIYDSHYCIKFML
ncbi:RmlC-like cupin domain-containing protein, partial [Mucidula mucida]